MADMNEVREYLADETSPTGTLSEAIRHLDPRRDVERHVVKVRRSVARLLRSLGELERDEEQLDEHPRSRPPCWPRTVRSRPCPRQWRPSCCPDR